MKNISLILIFVSFISYNQVSYATIYPLPKNGSLVGDNIRVSIPVHNKFPLEHFAEKYQMGMSNMLEANPHTDVYLPQGVNITIPQQLILPNAPRKGIVINSVEMRLYYYLPGGNEVAVFPIGIGELGRETPRNWITTVMRKKANPTWTPTRAMHNEYASRGTILPRVVPAGPANPMGQYALYVGSLYAIHGTNSNFGVGLRVSHGCVRLRNNDIQWLFEHTPVGTPVRFIDQAIKVTLEKNGFFYIEVHDPLSRNRKELNSSYPIPIKLSGAVRKVLSDPRISSDKTSEAISDRSGIPTKISLDT